MVKLIKLCLNEPQSTVQLGKHLPDTFSTRNGLEQGDDLSPFFFQICFRVCHYEGPDKPGWFGIKCIHISLRLY